MRLTFIASGLVTSIVRFATFFQKNSFVDGTWSAVDLIIWTQVETGVYLISACLMTYRPLIERIGRGRFVGKLTHLSSTPNGHLVTSKNTGQQNSDIPLNLRGQDDKYGFHRLENDDGVDPRITMTTTISICQNPKGAQEDFDSGGPV